MKKAPPSEKKQAVRQWLVAVLWLLGIAVAAVLGAWLLSGCVVPSESQLDFATGKITTTTVAYTVPLTGLPVLHAALEDDTGIGLIGLISIILGGSAGLTTLLPKGWDLWRTIFGSGIPVPDKVQAVGALAIPALHSPPQARALADARDAKRSKKKLEKARAKGKELATA